MEENRRKDEDDPFPQRVFRLLRSLPIPRRLSQRIQWRLLWLVVVGYVVFVLVRLLWPRADHVIQSQLCGPHRPELSVDLTNSEVGKDGVRTEKGIRYPPFAVWENGGHIMGCPCLVKYCMRMCDSSQTYIHVDADRIYTFWTVLEPGEKRENMRVKYIDHENIYTVNGPPDCKTKQGVLGAVYENVGKVEAVMDDGRIMTSDFEYLDLNDYCLETTLDHMAAVRCVEISPLQEPKAWEKEMPRGRHENLVIISLVAVVSTVFVYLYLPQLRNIHGKLLVGFLIFLFVNSTQFFLIHDRWPKQLEYLWQYTYLGHLCWISTIGFDVWLIICGPVRPYHHQRENVLLPRYALFACLCPAVLCGLTWATSVVPYREDACPRPRFRDDTCRFTKEIMTQVFYHVPVGVLASLNLLLYLFMIYSLRIHPKPPCTSPLGHASLVAKQGFQMYTDVSKVMIFCGLCLLLMTTTAVKYCTLILRLLVSLYFSQGILIFVILCCNVRTFKLWLQKRLESSMTKPMDIGQSSDQIHADNVESSV